jgi:hypothetical protein
MTAYDDSEGKVMHGKARQAKHSIGWESITESPFTSKPLLVSLPCEQAYLHLGDD